MHRRSFLKFLGAPVPETTLSEATEPMVRISYSQIFKTNTFVKVDGEMMVVKKVHDGVIEVERPGRWTIHGVSV